MSDSRSHRFLHGLTWNAIGQAGVWVISFAATPYLLRTMGHDAYGLWVLLHMAAGWLLLLTFGAPTTTIKFVAERAGAGDRAGVRDAVGLALQAHVLGVAAGGALLALAAPKLASGPLNIQPDLRALAVLCLRAGGLGAVFLSLFQGASAVLQGLHRFDLQNMLQLALAALLPLGAAACLATGLDLRWVSAWFILLHAAMAGAGWIVALRALPAGKEGAALEPVEPSRFRRYGLGLWLGQVAATTSSQMDRLFIGHHLTLAELTLYAVPAGLIARLQTVSAMVSSTLMPILSEVRGPDETSELRRLYLRAVQGLLWVVLPPLASLAAVLPQLLGLWVGPEFGSAAVWPARLLIAAQALCALYYPPATLCASRNLPLYHSALGWSQALVSIAAWAILVPRYKLLGAAGGAFLAQALTVGPFLLIVHRKVLRLGPVAYLREALAGPAAGAMLVLILALPLHHLADTWPRLLALIAVPLAACYALGAVLLPREDWEALLRFARRERPAGENP